MKTTFFFMFFLMGFSLFIHSQVPNKTVCIKHPDAEQFQEFLKKQSVLFFEIKGDKAEVEKIIQQLRKHPEIQSCTPGKTTADFYAFQITFKKNPSAEEFKKMLKDCGVIALKINNHSPENL